MKKKVVSGFGLVSLIINITFGLAILHVFETKGYLQTGSLRNLLVWALPTSLICTALMLLRGVISDWVPKHALILALDALASLLPFVLIRCLRVPSPQTRLQLIGLVYALFVFAKVVLVACYLSSTVNSEARRYSLSAWIFILCFLLYSSVSPWAAMAVWPTGDEPAYLLLSHSLVADHDFDLANNYRQRDYKLFYPAEPRTSDHHTLRNDRGQELPVHDVGISVLLVPGYALAGRLGAMVEMNVFASFLALGIFVLALTLGATQHAALTCCILFAFTSPLAVYSSQIYPEAVGGACSLWAIVAFARFERTGRLIFSVLAASLLAVLPWLSVRYWMILVPMLFVFLLYTIVHSPSAAQIWHSSLAITLPIAISLASFCWFDMRHFRVPIPNAGYVLLVRAWRAHNLSLFVSNPTGGLLGLVFDRAFGLIPTAPIYMLSIRGALAKRKISWISSAILLPSVVYILFSAFNRYWYGGWAPPSRYIFVSLALLAPFAAMVLSEQMVRVPVFPLVAWSFLVSIAFTAFPLTRYSYWDDRASSLARFGQKTLGFDFGAVFPSLIRPGLRDYVLAAMWAGVVAGCMWLLARTRNVEAVGYSPETAKQRQTTRFVD